MAQQNRSKAVYKLPRALRAALFYFIQWTWGLPQNLTGLALFALMGRQRRMRYHGAEVTLFENTRFMPANGAVSLGTFIFIPLAWGEASCRQTAVHEYGHTVQSMILGPFYLLAVGLPSIIWAKRWTRCQTAPLPVPAAKNILTDGNAPAVNKPNAYKAKKLKRRLALKNARYTSRYPENWANALGEYATGEKPPQH